MTSRPVRQSTDSRRIKFIVRFFLYNFFLFIFTAQSFLDSASVPRLWHWVQCSPTGYFKFVYSLTLSPLFTECFSFLFSLLCLFRVPWGESGRAHGAADSSAYNESPHTVIIFVSSANMPLADLHSPQKICSSSLIKHRNSTWHRNFKFYLFFFS